MLKRLWLLVSGVWALIALWGGINSGRGLEWGDVAEAFVPGAMAWLLFMGARFVITGSVMKNRG